ncbi:MAG: DUF4349 domain-containing protein, partial [Actinobacteria bacterium]|nr:DUF4349 domain-containing protein [Actinomycetota bacterium]
MKPKIARPSKALPSGLFAIGLLVTGLLLGACGSGSPTAAEVAPGMATGVSTDALPAEAAVSETKINSDPISSPQVIRSAYVDIRVADVADATAQVVAATASRAGTIDSQNINSDGTSSYANIVARVP